MTNRTIGGGMGGAWFARNVDGTEVRPFAREIDALRFANGEGHLKVVFIPFGEDACSYQPGANTPKPPVYRGAPTGEGADDEAAG